MGRVLASTPFHAFNPEIPAILGDQLVGGSDPEHSDNLLKWDGAQTAYIVFWKNDKGEWLQVPSTAVSTNELMPGEGFWIVNRQLYSQTLYLSGDVVLEDDYSMFLTESLNLLAYPYCASIALNDTTLAKDGALGGIDPSKSDIVTETLEQQNYWLLNDPASPQNGKWLDDNDLLSQELLNPGRAYWYRRSESNAFVWTENRPYEDPFSEDGCPQILNITPDQGGRSVTLRITAEECSKSILEIYYQDIESTGRFDAASGWKLAAEGILADGNGNVLWTDKGSDIHEPVYRVNSRIYLVARGDVDLDENGIPDARERFGVKAPVPCAKSARTITRRTLGQTASISGTVTNEGTQSGQIWVKATPGETTWISDYATLADTQGNYTLTNIPQEQTWWIRSWKDADTNGLADICEPQGQYAGSIYLTNDQTGIDFTLVDDQTPPSWVFFGETSLVVECDASVEPVDLGIPAIMDDRGIVSDNGLIAYYSFDNYASGSALADDSGAGNTGTVYGSVVVVPGLKGSAFQFDGDSYVDIGDLSAVEGKYALTWGGWIYPTGTGLYGVLGKTTSGNESFYLVLDCRSGWQIDAYIMAETRTEERYARLTNTIQASTWQHIMGTYDGTQVKVYFNGELAAVSPVFDYEAIRSNTVRAAIADSCAGRGWLFEGKLDELRVYDRVLADDEIRRLYNAATNFSLTFSNTVVAGACAQAQTITREWTAADACGNSTSRCQVITVQDTTTPVFVWTPANTTLTSSASTHPDFTGWPVVSDNCDSLALPEEDKLWVNEFHYDNDSTDTNEFIEVAGAAGTDLSEYRLVLYNGYNGTVYGITNLNGSIDDEGCGYGAAAFFIPGLQNGDPDGFALCRDSEVLQFISYEGSFAAADGQAAGLTSTDMGKKETTYSPVGYSLQLKGTGAMYQAFAWQSPSDDSPGTLNGGQVISPCGQGGMTLSYSDDVDAENCGTITRTWTVEDSCGNNDTTEQVITITDTNPPVMTIPADVSLSCNNLSSPEYLGYATALSASQLANLQPNEIAWINEFHYDNAGADTGEFFEVAGLAGVNLSEYTMVGYNGSDGGMYGTISLSGIISNEGCGYGAKSFVFLGMQNGYPDGLALCRNGQVVQFISYEGSFTATDGPATGMTSTNIGVSESSSTPTGFSLRVVGSGRGAADFGWVAPDTSSPGRLNPGQYISPCSPVGLTLAFTDTVTYADTVYTKTITRTWTAADSCGNSTSGVQTISYPACDTDGDGLPDGWEILYGLDPNDGTGDNGASGDPDDDGLSNLDELSIGTQPNNRDTDGDGASDGDEILYNLDPLVNSGDYDQDGLSDDLEAVIGTDPDFADSDFDWAGDAYEYNMGTDPLLPSSAPPLLMIINGGDIYSRTTNLVISFPGLVAEQVVIGEITNLDDGVFANFTTNIHYGLRHCTNDLRFIHSRLLRNTQESALITGSITYDDTPPVFGDTDPSNGFVTARRWIKMTGLVSDSVSQVRVFVNEEWAHGGDAESFWHDRCMLHEGTNIFIINGVDMAGNSATQTFEIVQDTSGDVTAPSLSIMFPGQIIVTNEAGVWPMATYGDCPDLFFGGIVDDETADIETFVISDGATNGPLDAVVVGTQVWGRVGLFPGTNIFQVTASDAAGNISTALCIVVRNTGLVFNITYPAPYQIMNSASTIVSGIASPLFLNATITVNGVSTVIEDHESNVVFTTVSGVPLSEGRTELIGRADINGSVYVTDPPPVGYEIVSCENHESYIWDWRGDYGCDGFVDIWPLHSVWRWTAQDKLIHYNTWYDSWYYDCSYDCFGGVYCYDAPSPYTESIYLERPDFGFYIGQYHWTGSFPGETWQIGLRTHDAGIRFIKRWPTQETQIVILQFPDMRMGGNGHTWLTDSAPPVTEPSLITYRGQTGFWYNGNVSFIVPITTEVEYSIKEADFTWPSYQEPIMYSNGAGVEKGKIMGFNPMISNDLMKVELTHIKFDYQGPDEATTDGLNILKGYDDDLAHAGNGVGDGEWILDTGRNEPFLYVADKIVKIKAKFRITPAINTTLEIGADTIGGVFPNITPKNVSFAGGVSVGDANGYVEFDLSGKSHEFDGDSAKDVAKSVDSWQWKITTDASACDISISGPHTNYCVLDVPQTPWYEDTKTHPWVSALEHACAWAGDSTGLPDAVDKVASGIYDSGQFDYDYDENYFDSGTATHNLTACIDRLNGSTTPPQGVNCVDCANFTVSFGNLLGAHYWNAEIGLGTWLTEKIWLIHASSGPTWKIPSQWEFVNHQICWSGSASDGDKVFDATINWDGDGTPGTQPPVTWEVPGDIIFSDGTEDTPGDDYRDYLTVPSGWANCVPTGTKYRRKIK